MDPIGDDATLIMEVLVDVRRDVRRIIDILEGTDGEEREEDA